VLEQPAWSVDLRATIDAWCAAGAPPTDGRDLAAWLAGSADSPPRAMDGYWESAGYGGQQAVAWTDGTHRWKAIRQELNKLGKDAPVTLFDLSVDPREERDVAAANPAVVAEARRRMRASHAPNDAFPLKGAMPAQ
jgi:hypothetical protein